MIDAILKAFDSIIGKRLRKWWRPDPEQIGDKAIACTDHILALHIWISIAKASHKKLYILFVDFSKAYDRVSRSKLMSMLKSSGCGRVLLRAVFIMYKVTKLLYENTTIQTNTGVKQGSPSSGFLFTFFINPLIRRLKQCGADDFLQDLHCLLMMDDSVIMATSREAFLQKIEILMQFCEEHGMLVNELKTQFMIINNCETDKQPITPRPNLVIKYTTKYVYLGATITDDGNMNTVMKEHAKMKNAHYLKFAAFIKKNSNAPFYVKRQVFRACIMSTLLYSSEVWCTNGVDKSIRKIYLACIRGLLGVRNSTDTDLCLHEAMMPSIEAMVYDIQRKYFVKILSSAENHPLLCRIMEIGRKVKRMSGHETKCKVMKHIDKIIETNDRQRLLRDMENRRDRIARSMKTKTLLYKQWNPTLAYHDVYTTRKHFPEHWRVAWTRFKLGSTDLPCEKARWSKVVVNPECSCGETQTEQHILLECIERVTQEMDTAEELFCREDQHRVMKSIYDTLQKYENT